MSELILKSLQIHQFRTFKHLEIPHLSRVNLITGKNNVGKSCFLEALWLYANRGSQIVIWELLETRDESVRLRFLSERDAKEEVGAIRYLFHGRKDIQETIFV